MSYCRWRRILLSSSVSGKVERLDAYDRQVSALGVANERTPALQAVVDRLGDAASRRHCGAGGQEPGLESFQTRQRRMGAQRGPRLGSEALGLTFDGVEFADLRQRRGSERMRALRLQLEEFAPRMRPAGKLDDLARAGKTGSENGGIKGSRVALNFRAGPRSASQPSIFRAVVGLTMVMPW